jgi:hypothetical protein
MALQRRLGAIAITDHDTVDGVAEAKQAAAGHDLLVLSGVEISAEAPDSSRQAAEVHLLGYFVDPAHAELRETLWRMRAARLDRAAEMVERMAALGVPISWQQLVQRAGEGTVGRAHIAQVMLDAGYVSTIAEAFERYIGPGGPAYVPRAKLAPGEAMDLIRRAGGVPVLAHPWPDLERVAGLAALGLVGLEVHYPRYSPELVTVLTNLARKHGLLCTGGSDFHGIEIKPDYPLGSVTVPLQRVDDLWARRSEPE